MVRKIAYSINCYEFLKREGGNNERKERKGRKERRKEGRKECRAGKREEEEKTRLTK
jgi:hypothetical protein